MSRVLPVHGLMGLAGQVVSGEHIVHQSYGGTQLTAQVGGHGVTISIDNDTADVSCKKF